jgi:hypothetical protein
MDSHGKHKLRIHWPLVTSFLLRARLRGTDTLQVGDRSIRLTFNAPSTGWWAKSLCGSLLLLMVIVMFGCTDIVTPLQPGDQTSMRKPGHGLVLGRVHLTWNRADQRSSAPLPSDVRWLITEEKSGTHLWIDHVPVNGPFVVDLPTGSYQLTSVSLDDMLGVWHTSLPAMFIVRQEACTNLGTWELEMHTKSFVGSMRREVLDQQELARRDLRTIVGEETARSLPMVTQLGTSTQSPLVFTFVSTSGGLEHVETLQP